MFDHAIKYCEEVITSIAKQNVVAEARLAALRRIISTASKAEREITHQKLERDKRELIEKYVCEEVRQRERKCNV